MSNSPQFIRTDKAITQALIRLLHDKSFEKITVQDILNETPVTRATFYMHFHDKYEIAEKMQEEFLIEYNSVKKDLNKSPFSRRADYIRKSFFENREIMEALLKIHTEKVDLRQAIAKELEREYIENSNSPCKETEARIFAQARTEFQLAFLYDNKKLLNMEYMSQINISVALSLLNIPDDEETREYLKQKIIQNN